MTDKELLIHAAKAYGLYTKHVGLKGIEECWVENVKEEDGKPKDPSWGLMTVYGVWNPLINMEQNFKLMVMLQGELDCTYWNHIDYNVIVQEYDKTFVENVVGDNRIAAACRVVVTAAAYIGAIDP